MRNKPKFTKQVPSFAALTTVICALVYGAINPVYSSDSQPKLYEPYAPKPSGKPPEGWEIKILEGSQVENSTNLNGKKEIKVTVPAYEIVPKTTESTKVIKDPGFDPKLATSQKSTIGAVLTEYSEQAQELQVKLDKVIIELEEGLGARKEGSTTEKAENKPQTQGKNAKK
jgi:hypothetical protein